jgi:undecaprenyl-diphosphatase
MDEAEIEQSIPCRVGYQERKCRFASPAFCVLFILLRLMIWPSPAWACPNLIDCTPEHKHKQGVWKLAKPDVIPLTLITLAGAGALWEGGEDRLGHTLWQSLDATALAAASAGVLKHSLGRQRPEDTDHANRWFKGGDSFPSGNATLATAVVTPIILEYGPGDPRIYWLAALPAFDMAGRIAYKAHWPTDVLAGALLGFASGYLAHQEQTPWILSVMPQGVYIGIKHRF